MSDAHGSAADFEAARAARRAGHPERAVALLDRIARSHPASAAHLVLLGVCHSDLRRHDAAVAAFDRALALAPDHAGAHTGRGVALMQGGRMPEALESALRATALAPDRAAAWRALGRVFSRIGTVDLAAKAFRRASALAPDQPDLKGLVLQEQMTSCDWRGIDALIADVEAHVARGERAVSPFFWHAVSTSSESLLQVARQASALDPSEPMPMPMPMPARPAADRDDRIAIGYVSGELSTSANALCMAGVFAAHDRSALRVVAFDNGEDDGSPLRRRIAASFDEVMPVSAMSDRELAAAVAALGIDVLVNLNGFFGKDRSAAFRFRPAPVQVNYLGCPGTMGSPCMDYIVADAVVLPQADARFYDEKVVRLPDTYYPTDRARPISPRRFSRPECGLPADAFVFCCFNMSHKILPATFAGWTRILHGVPGSVLWLIGANAAAVANLRREAAARGIDPQRLVFADRLAPDEHLARHACADLFLDTLPYNAHTTATDALWSGLPVLTLAGTTFPGRVGASLLGAVGLGELVTATPEAYERRAIELAHDPSELARLRRRLDANRLTAPLFDTARYTQHLEAAYRAMVERHRAGLPPADIAVGAGKDDALPECLPVHQTHVR